MLVVQYVDGCLKMTKQTAEMDRHLQCRASGERQLPTKKGMKQLISNNGWTSSDTHKSLKRGHGLEV